jgi:glycosyltransferase involved in cell wall biosynthesis
MPTSVSVIVCTFNRCESLVDTLRSLIDMRVPNGIDWDVLVVDNNSRDETRSRVEAMAATSLDVPIRYLCERTPGLSHARNLGVRSTQSTYIAFTDDDVFVEKDWLANIVRAFTNQGVDCVGGRVVPHWLGPRPAWLKDDLLHVLAMLDYGGAAFDFTADDHRILFGANFAFRRDALIRMGLFNVSLGRKGQFGAGEDKEAFEKLRAVGGRAAYDPEISVLHKVPPERMEKRYFRKWHYAAGKDRAHIRRASRFRILGIESYLLRDFGRVVSAYLRSIVWRRDRIFFEELRCILFLSLFKHKLLRQ